MTRARRLELVGLALVIAVYAALLGRAVSYAYVWDDVHEIQNSDAFDRPFAEGVMLTQTARQDPSLTQLTGAQLIYDSYRPLLFATYWAEVRAFGKDPAPMHATNLALGALAIVLAYALARRVLGSPRAAVAVAAIFALHPAQIEAVAYVSGRGDLLAGVLAMAAALAALRAADGRRAWVVVSCLAFAGSLLSKEACVGLPLAVAGLLFARGALRRCWWIVAALVGVVGAYLALRAAVVTATTGGAVSDAVVLVPGVVVEYARIFALPFDLSTERLHDAKLGAIGWVVAALAAAIVAGVAVRARARLTSDAGRATLGAIAWLVALLGPAAMPIASTHVVADRYFYTSLWGFAVLAVVAARAITAARPATARVLLVAGALWLAVFAIVDLAQVPVWADNESLYSHAVEMTPDSSEAHYRVGYLYAVANRPEAMAELQRAIELDPNNVRALDDLGVVLLRAGRDAEAEDILSRAVQASPISFRSWFNLGLTRLRRGARSDGCAAISRALAINPSYDVARRELAASCR